MFRSVLNWVAQTSPTQRTILTIGVAALVIFAVFAVKSFILRPPGHQPIPSPTQTKTPADSAPEDQQEMTYEEMFKEIAPQYNLDWKVLEALAYRESRMDYLAVGVSNEMGLMQIIPSTWAEWAPKAGVKNPFDPYSNIQVGAAYLAFVRDLCTKRGHSEPHCMLVGYQWGPNRLARFFEKGGTWDEVPATQRRYAQSIVKMANTRAQNTPFFQEIYANIAVD